MTFNLLAGAVYAVRKDSDGKYSGYRAYNVSEIPDDGKETIFVITKDSGEDLQVWRERCRQEARRRGIEHVDRLDD